MGLSKNTKTFCCNFIAFLGSTLNFEHSEKTTTTTTITKTKKKLHGWSISEIIFVVTYTHKRSCFWKHFGSQRVNGITLAVEKAKIIGS